MVASGGNRYGRDIIYLYDVRVMAFIKRGGLFCLFFRAGIHGWGLPEHAGNPGYRLTGNNRFNQFSFYHDALLSGSLLSYLHYTQRGARMPVWT